MRLLPKLTRQERMEFDQYEQTIERGLKVFYEVGIALSLIREKRLYREQYSAFEDYCIERWDMSKTNANRQIASSNVMETLTPIGVKVLPENEYQTRPLAKLTPDKQIKAWLQVIETAPDGKITTTHIAAVVKQLIEKEKPKTDAKRQLDFPKLSVEREFKHQCAFCETLNSKVYSAGVDGINICSRCAEKALNVLQPQRLYPYQLYAIIKNDPHQEQQSYDEYGNAVPLKIIGIGSVTSDEHDIEVDNPQRNYHHQDLIFGYLNKDEQFINLTGNEERQQTT